MTKVTIEEENKNLKLLLEKAKQEIAKWKEKEFQACSKHHEFIDDIERLEKEIEEHCETKGLLGKQVFALTKRVDELTEENTNLKQYKKVLMESSVVRSDYIKELENELIEAYRSRGNMYWAGEKEWIDERIKELEGE